MNATTHTAVQQIRSQLLLAARAQKLRVRKRLAALRGSHILPPSRGPIQSNGYRCIRWHFWQAAKHKQATITQQITAITPLKSPGPNAKQTANLPII